MGAGSYLRIRELMTIGCWHEWENRYDLADDGNRAEGRNDGSAFQAIVRHKGFGILG